MKKTGIPNDLIKIIISIVDQSPSIRVAFIDHQNYTDSINSSGDQQAAMDKWANNHLINILKDKKLVHAIASEEETDIITVPSGSKYSVVMDPLDGSSLISVNLCVGTIVGIYDGDIYQPGNNLKCAFYLLYGPTTTLTITVGMGVSVFVLNESGVFQLLNDNIKIPEGMLYGSGGLRTEWLPEHTQFISQIENDGGKNRYSGSFVADFHQILKYGGIYAYPPTKKSLDGKLRLLFEVNPIGYLAVQAGGAVSTGKMNPLNVIPEKVHQKSPIYIGSKHLIDLIEKIHSNDA
ncbi:MAG TPA: fructose-1,6-bisphosphatase [Methanocorpusculum sp.]|nr:fructose-1,6-bisphosphatase [Methanocorpusculum sp.]